MVTGADPANIISLPRHRPRHRDVGPGGADRASLGGRRQDLEAATERDLSSLKYFRLTTALIRGVPVTITRTGYTGERGYELFCKGVDAPKLWDTILAEGKEMGIMPCSFTTLDWLRVESCLLFYPYDNSDMYPMEGQPIGDSLWELGLDFTVSPGKTGFRGAAEHARLKGKERFKIYGVEFDSQQAAEAGDSLFRHSNTIRVGSSTALSTNSLLRPSRNKAARPTLAS